MASPLTHTSDVQADNDNGEALRHAPHNLEAEQALLGAILMNNEALNQVPTNLTQEHFYAPAHQHIYAAIRTFFDKGMIANPVTLKHHFTEEDGIEDAYLAQLVAAAATVVNVRDYCSVIMDLAIKRNLIRIGEDTVNKAYDRRADEDAVSQIEEAEQKLFKLGTDEEVGSGFVQLRSSLVEAVERAEQAYKNQGSVVGVSTGLTDMDRLLGGLKPSDLIILAGRPSMGKTALATTIAFNAARIMHHEDQDLAPGEKPRSVGFFSLEMSGEQLANRMLASAAGIGGHKLLRGELTNDEFATLVQRSNELASLPYHIDDTPALSIAAVRTRARRLKRVHNLSLLVVDYLQLLRGSAATSAQGRVQEISEITQGLKAIAKELDIPVIALSQLSRAVEQREDKRPQLSDLRESGSIEQDADVVMFVYREEYYLARKQPREDTPEHAVWQEEMEQVYGLADAIIAKQRHGPIGTVTMAFQSDLTRFEDRADDEYMPERRE